MAPRRSTFQQSPIAPYARDQLVVTIVLTIGVFALTLGVAVVIGVAVIL